jgi:cell division protein FtsI (penicillin-binding protein 3)
MDKPRYLTLVCLFEPQGTKETGGRITAGLNAAPTTARIISRISPLLGFLPNLEHTRTPDVGDRRFDGPRFPQ